MKFSVSAVGLLSAISLSVAVSNSYAFGPVPTSGFQTGSFGACSLVSRIDAFAPPSPTRLAFTYLETTSPPQTYAPGGTIYGFDGNPQVAASPLSVAVLQGCADSGGLPGTVSNLVEYVADQTWATEDLYGMQWDFSKRSIEHALALGCPLRQ